MDVEFRMAMRESIYRELMDAVDDARQGMLSPHWQEYIRREVEAARESDYPPKNADELLAQLKFLFAKVPQISDAELNRKQLALSGTKLLYDYPTDDYDTIVSLTYQPDKRLYTTTAFLDADAAKNDLYQYAKNIALALRAWVKEQEIPFEENEIPAEPPHDQIEYFDNINAALQHLFSALRTPKTLL